MRHLWRLSDDSRGHATDAYGFLAFLDFSNVHARTPPQEKSKTPTPLAASGCTGEPQRGGAHCRFVAERAEAADHTDRDVREIRLPPKRLTGVRVRQMHLDERQP